MRIHFLACFYVDNHRVADVDSDGENELIVRVNNAKRVL